jgi:ABC-type Na+ efflux pump permease subunit
MPDISFVMDENDDYDLKLRYEEDKYIIDVRTKKGYDNYSRILNVLQGLSVGQFLQAKQIDIAEFEEYRKNSVVVNVNGADFTKVDERTLIFLMYMTMIFYFIMVLLISRIGAAVAFEKGNKVTEVILTSITKKQLYFSQVVSSCMVIGIIFLVISIPMIIAYVIKDPELVSDFTMFDGPKFVLFLLHLITVTVCLVICSIGCASLTKRIEDANVVSIISLLSVAVSYLYYVIRHDLFRGAAYILNYIPYFSAFPIFGAILTEGISLVNAIVICVINVAFAVATYFMFRVVYCKNISSN